MGALTRALLESFDIEEGLQDEVLNSLEETGSLEESLYDEVMTDIDKYVDPTLPASEPAKRKNLGPNATLADMILDENPDLMEESLMTESIWDKIAPALGAVGNREELGESLITEAPDNLPAILDRFYDLMMKQDLGPAEAKKRILGEVGMNESLQESKEPELSRKEKQTKRKADYMESICKQFRESARFGLDEELTEEKLKYEGWRIKDLAARKGIPSADIREALLKGNK